MKNILKYNIKYLIISESIGRVGDNNKPTVFRFLVFFKEDFLLIFTISLETLYVLWLNQDSTINS